MNFGCNLAIFAAFGVGGVGFIMLKSPRLFDVLLFLSQVALPRGRIHRIQ
jgi:hypothetical protein